MPIQAISKVFGCESEDVLSLPPPVAARARRALEGFGRSRLDGDAAVSTIRPSRVS